MPYSPQIQLDVSHTRLGFFLQTKQLLVELTVLLHQTSIVSTIWFHLEREGWRGKDGGREGGKVGGKRNRGKEKRKEEGEG